MDDSPFFALFPRAARNEPKSMSVDPRQRTQRLLDH
jgi:hypothetical protein